MTPRTNRPKMMEILALPPAVQPAHLPIVQKPTLPSPLALPSLLPSARRPRRTSSHFAWMVTFTDLVALMLTFFVLLFSMSQLQQTRWQSLAESLASNLNAVSRIETTKMAADFQAETEAVPPGADLDYLEPILREHFASEPALAGGTIDRVGEGLSIAFPGERLFVGVAAEMTARGSSIVSATGGILRNLRNAVDVDVRVEGAARPTAADWQTALARSVAITRLLSQAGFTGPIVARGVGNAPLAGADGRASAGIRLLVREDRRDQR